MKNIITYLLVAVIVSGCHSAEKAPQNAGGYDLSKPEKFLMPESLLEISGIAFPPNRNDTIYAIQDEEGKVFRLVPGLKQQWHAKFGKQGDYEDIAIINEKIFVLQSNGTLYEFPFADAIYSEVDSVQEWKHVLPPGEYESMYAGETSGKLYILCKNCETDNNKDAVSGYIISAANPTEAPRYFSIDVKSISHITGKVKRGFRPSALAKNEITNEWYIVSAVNQLLVVTDANWAIKNVYHLDGNTFNQPEGIAFDKEGNMYISNEGGDLSAGNILKFRRK